MLAAKQSKVFSPAANQLLAGSVAADGTSTGYIYFGEEGIECPVNTVVTIESLGPGAGKAWVGNIVWKTKA